MVGTSGIGPLRLALAGVGRMGSHHLAALLQRDDVELCAIADPSTAARAKAIAVATRAGRADRLAIYDDVGVMLSVEKPSAVIIATPSQLHVEHCLVAIRAGVAVLIEKPLATTIDGAERVVLEAHASAVLVTVGHVERFNPAFDALRAELLSSTVGPLKSIRTSRCGSPPVILPAGGVALDLAVHDVDLICELAGEEPVALRSRSTDVSATEVELESEIEFASGVSAHLVVGWLKGARRRRMVITCARGKVEADWLTQEVRSSPFGTAGSVVRTLAGSPLAREHDAFVTAVFTGGAAPVSAREGLRALRIVHAMLASASRRQRIELASTAFAAHREPASQTTEKPA